MYIIKLYFEYLIEIIFLIWRIVYILVLKETEMLNLITIITQIYIKTILTGKLH